MTDRSDETAENISVSIVNLSECAELLGMTTPTLSSLIKRNPDFPVEARGSHGNPYEFDVARVVAWHRAHLAQIEAEKEARREALQQQRLELFPDLEPDETTAGLPARQVKEELEAQRLADLVRAQRGELLQRHDVDATIRAALGELQRALRQIGPDLARDFGLEREVRIRIDARIREAFNAALDRAAVVLDEQAGDVAA